MVYVRELEQRRAETAPRFVIFADRKMSCDSYLKQQATLTPNVLYSTSYVLLP